MEANAPPGIDPARVAKVRELRRRGIEPYQYQYERTHTVAELRERFEATAAHDPGGEAVRVAGRIMAHRHMGRVAFADLMDSTGRIQLYARQDDLGPESFEDFASLDLGDIIGGEGRPFKTRKGEFSLWLSSFAILTKPIRHLPDKWHGLRDVEFRYRNRTADLIASPEVRRTFLQKSRFLAAIRAWMNAQGYVEVDTPVLERVYGGAAARPFITHHNFLEEDLFLRIALEIPLKRIVAGGMERVYEIASVFRNEKVDAFHNAEFLMFEVYEAYVDYTRMMWLTETMLSHVAEEVFGTKGFDYQGQRLSFQPPWKRANMVDLVDAALDLHVLDVGPEDLARAALEAVARGRRSKAISAEQAAKVEAVARTLLARSGGSWGELVNELYEVFVQPQIVQPTFVCDYPVEVSPLTKRKRGNPRLTERFEPTCMGVEFGNAYSELTDPLEQRQRFEEQLRRMAQKGGEAEGWLREIDEEFMYAMEVGMPPMGGLGLGLERIFMFMTNNPSIKEVILFPTMRSEKRASEAGQKSNQET